MRVPSGLADTCPLKNASYRDRARWCNVLRARREPAARKSRRSVGAWVTQQAATSASRACSSGCGFRELLEREWPNLVVLDLMLPRLSADHPAQGNTCR
jgi:hypothetical protein